jgi:hypothetical protein
MSFAFGTSDVSLTSGTRSPDETDGSEGSVSHSIFVRFTSNFVLPKFQLDGNLTKSLTGREIPHKRGLEEVEI